MESTRTTPDELPQTAVGPRRRAGGAGTGTDMDTSSSGNGGVTIQPNHEAVPRPQVDHCRTTPAADGVPPPSSGTQPDAPGAMEGREGSAADGGQAAAEGGQGAPMRYVDALALQAGAHALYTSVDCGVAPVGATGASVAARAPALLGSSGAAAAREGRAGGDGHGSGNATDLTLAGVAPGGTGPDAMADARELPRVVPCGMAPVGTTGATVADPAPASLGVTGAAVTSGSPDGGGSQALATPAPIGSPVEVVSEAPVGATEEASADAVTGEVPSPALMGEAGAAAAGDATDAAAPPNASNPEVAGVELERTAVHAGESPAGATPRAEGHEGDAIARNDASTASRQQDATEASTPMVRMNGPVPPAWDPGVVPGASTNGTLTGAPGPESDHVSRQAHAGGCAALEANDAPGR